MQTFQTSRDEAAALFKIFHLEDLLARLGTIQEGEEFQVSDEFPLTVEGVAARAQVLGQRVRGDEIEQRDANARRALANRCTLYRILLQLEGRRHLIAKLGEGATLDKVNITSAQFGTCECVTSFLWHRDTNGENRIPLKSEYQCEAHRGLKCGRKESSEHLDTLISECSAVNKGRAKIAEELGCHFDEVEWKFDKDRSVVFSHPTIAGKKGAQKRAALTEAVSGVTDGRAVRIE